MSNLLNDDICLIGHESIDKTVKTRKPKVDICLKKIYQCILMDLPVADRSFYFTHGNHPT